ncbi:hypothetical protein BGX34_006861, partial [Mortierella sp. NVP85]
MTGAERHVGTQPSSSSSLPQRPSAQETYDVEQQGATFSIDTSAYYKLVYLVGRQDIGQLLCEYQVMSVEYVNNFANKATMFNIHYFFATNYILDLTAKKIPGLNAETFQIIKDGYTVEP